MRARNRPLRCWLALLATMVMALPSGVAVACGPDSDCRVGERSYRIRLPPGAQDQARVGAILVAHGYRDSAANMMAHAELAAAVAGLGLALIAPQSRGDAWALPNAPSGGDAPPVDEVVAMQLLLADVAARFPVDRARIMAAGFSNGGMLVWHLACHAGPLFAGYAPVSGTYWSPVPAACPTGPVTILHTHGTNDAVVPLAGRRVRDTRQGDVMEAVGRYAAVGRFAAPTVIETAGLHCETRRNPEGRVLEICLHPGGHELRAEDLVRAWRSLARLNGW